MSKLNWRKIPDTLIDREILFIAASGTASNSSSQGVIHRQYHEKLVSILREIGLTVHPTSELGVLLNQPSEKYVYGIHSHSWFNGKEVFTSVLAEYHAKAYLGPKPTVRALIEDKKLSRIFAMGQGVPVTSQVEILSQQDFSKLPEGPWIIKPRNGIASQFVTYCETVSQLNDAYEDFISRADGRSSLLVEQFVPGKNFTVPIIEGIDFNSLPIFEEFDNNPQNILSFSGKRRSTSGYKREPYTGSLEATLRSYAAIIEKHLRPYDYGRIDFRCDTLTGQIYFLEANLICNISQGSAIAESARIAGASYSELIEHVVATSFIRQFGV